jgi:hypothetical protein
VRGGLWLIQDRGTFPEQVLSPVLLALIFLIRIRIRIFLGSEKLNLGELFDIFQAQHDWKNIGGVTVKFKSGVTVRITDEGVCILVERNGCE